MAPNLSVLAIPVYYILTLYPHQAALATILAANNKKWNNANPKSTSWDATLRASIPADIYARYERCEAAHRNGMENLPLFIGAVVLGNMARLSTTALNAFAMGYLLLRGVYRVLYMRTTSVKRSYWRTAVWSVGTAWALGVVCWAGFALA